MDISGLKATVALNPWTHDAVEKLHAALTDAGDLAGLQELHEALFERYNRDIDPEPLLRLVDLKARTATDEHVATFLYARLGLFYWRRLDNPDKAELYFRRIEGKTDGFANEYREFYTDFYARRGNWRRLEQFLMELAGNPTDPEGLIQVKRDLARLAVQTQKPDKAIVFWTDVRAVQPENAEAEAALSDLYVEVKKWHSLVELLQDRLKRLSDKEVAAKIDILLQMIAIYRDHIQSETKVNSTYQAILDIDPTNEMAQDALVTQYERMKRWPDLVRVLQQRIGNTKEKKALIALHEQVASIMMERFSNSAEALKSYAAILELDGKNKTAIANLKDLYEKRRDYESYLEIARREVALEKSEAKRSEKFLELARFAADKIRRPAAAIALWEDVLALDPAHTEALENLESLYEREKSYDKLCAVLDARIEAAAGDAERVALLEKLGLVVSARLADEERAAEVWKRILAVQPDHRKAQNELRKRYLATHDWDGLEWLFRRYGTVQELVRTLEAQIKTLDEPAEQIRLLFKSAELWQGEGQPSRAIRTLEQVLGLDPQNAEAASRLAPLYRQEGNWQKLAEALEIQLAAIADPGARQHLLLELARLYEDRLDDSDKAFFSFIQVYKENYEDEASRLELERLAGRSGNWDTYVAVLEETLPRISEPGVRLAAQLRTAEVYRDHIGDLDQALRHFQMSIALDPENRRAMDAIEDLYVRGEDWRLLVEVFKRKRQLAQSEEEEREILFKLGGVWRDRLQDNEEAARVFNELLQRFPDDARVHRELAAIYLIEEDYDGLLDVLHKELELLNSDLSSVPGDVAALHVQIAQLTYSTSGSLETVVHHYHEALQTDPDTAEALEGLEELVAADEVQREITQILEPIYRRKERWDRLADVYEIQLGYCGSDFERIALLQSVGELYRDRIGDDHRAFRSYARIFALEPDSTGVREQLEELAERLGGWVPLVELYEGHVDRVPDSALRREVRLTIADTYHQRLGDQGNAQLHYEVLLESDPDDSRALDALERIYGETGQFEALLSIYRRKLMLASAFEQRVSYLSRIEQVWSQQLGNIDEAIAAANEILDIDPDRVAAHRRLDDLYTRAGRWEDAAGALLQLIRLTTEQGARVELMGRLAEVREQRLSDVTGAIDMHALILDLDPENARTVAALERLFAARTHAAMVAPLLEPYYRRHDEWRKLVDVYEVEKESTEDPNARLRYDFRIAELYEHKGADQEAAFLYYGLAYQTRPDSEDALLELLRLADVLGNHAEAVALLARYVDEVNDPDRRREIHRIVAQTAEERVGDRETAKKHYREVLEIEPSDMAAIDALLRLYRDSGQWDALVDALRRKSAIVPEAKARAALLKEAGRISAVELDQPEQGIEIYEGIIELRPEDREALDALESLYARVEDWEKLTSILARKIELAPDVEQKKTIARERAHVLDAQLEALDDAVDVFRQILDWDPADQEAMRGLDDLFSRKGDWLDLLDVLRRMQPLVSEGERLDLQLRIGQVWEKELGDVFQAVDAWRALLDERPEDERALSALERIVLEKDEREQAFEVLVPALELLEQHQRLFDLHEVMAEHREDPLGRIRLLHRMAQIAESNLSDPRAAFGCHARAFRQDADHPETVSELERLAAKHGLWEDLQALYTEGADAAGDPLRAVELRLQAAAILKDRIGDAGRATARYEALREDHPDHRTVLQALDALYGQAEAWDKLAGVLRAEFEQTPDVREKVRLCFRLAELSEQRLGDANGAFESYREVLYLEPANDRAISELRRLSEAGVRPLEIAEILEPIYLEREDWAALHALYEVKLREVEDALDRSDILRRLAELNLERLDDYTAAMLWYGEALVLDPQDDFVLGQLETLAGATAEWAMLFDLELRGAEAAGDDERRVALWHKAVVIAIERLGETGRAEGLLLQVLELDGEDARALSTLDELYSQGGRWDDLEPVLSRRISVAEYDEDRIPLLARLGELYRDRLVKRDEAIAAYNRILDINEGDLRALRALAEIYEGGQDDWEPLWGVYRRLSSLVETDSERTLLLERMAGIAEQQLGRVPDAIELWEEVLLVEPGRRSALRELERLLESEGKNDALADAFERELGLLGEHEAARRAELHRRLGRLWRDVLVDPLQAQHHWEQVRALEPEDRETLVSLRAIYRDAVALEALIDVLENLVVADAYEGIELRDLWVELAELRLDVAGRPAEAIEAWEQVAAVDVGNERALEMLERLYGAEGRWADAVAILLRKAELRSADGEHQDAIELRMRAAELQRTQLQDLGAAAATYEDVLRRDPAHAEASVQLQRIYESSEQWARLTELLLARIEHTEDKTERVLTLHNLAAIFESRLDAADSAYLVHQRALGEDPDDHHSLVELERLATLTGAWTDLAAVWKEIIPQMHDPLLRADYRYRLGVVVRDRLDRLEQAALQFRLVLEQQPEHEHALQALVELYTMLEQWPELIATLQTLSEVTADYSERTQLAVRVGEVYERQLGDIDAALDAYRRVLDLDEMEDRALVALERLYEQREQWDELIEVLGLRSRVHASEELSFRLRIGEVYRTRLGNDAKAIESFEEVLQADPGNQAALSALERLYGDRNDFEGLVQVYERLLSSTDDGASRKTLCENIALVHEEVFGDKARAAEYFHEILTIDPMDQGAMINLERLYQALEQWEDLLQIIERHQEVVGSDRERVALLTRMAEVHRDKSRDLDGAIRAFERILDLDSRNAGALDALEALYRDNGFWEQVIDVQGRKLEGAKGAERTRLYCQRAEVFADKMLAPESAIAELDKALTEDPRSLPAVQALQQVHAATSDWEGVVSALLLEEGLHESDELRAATLVRVAEVYREHLMDLDRAVESYERALGYLPDYAPAAIPLSELYIKQEAWAKAEPLLSMMVDKLETEEDPAKAAELFFLIGRSKENLGNIPAAIESYEQALVRRPGDVPTLRGLARLCMQRERYEDAERHYLALVERIRHEAPDSELAECFMALGEIALTLHQDDRATEYLEQVVSLQPDNAAALGNLVQIARDHGNWRAVARYQGEVVALKHDPIEKLALQLEIGDVLKDRLGDVDGAVAAYREALDIQPQSKAALVKLLEIYLARRELTEAIETLQQLVEREEDPKSRGNYCFMLAVIYRDELGDDTQAAYYLGETLDNDHDRLEAFRALDELHTRNKAWKEEERAYRKMIERISGRGQQELEYKLYRGLGEIYRSRLKDYEYAISAFQLAAERKPDDVAAYEILAELYETAGGMVEKAVEAHRQLIRLEPDKRIGSYRALYRLYREAGEHDAAWCVAGVLAALGQADDEMARFYDEHREPSMAQAKRSLDGKLWQTGLLADPDDVLVGQIFQILYETLGGELRAKTLKDLDLKKKDQLQTSEGTMFGNVLVAAARALNVSEPKVYVSARQLGMRIENLNPPAVVIGNDMLTGKSEKELAFLLGKCLTYFLPIHVLAGIYSRPDLKTLLVAAMKVVLPQVPMGDAPGVQELAEEIARKLDPGKAEQLTELLQRASQGEVNLSNWMNNVELTGNHAGMLLCNDFETALKTLRAGAFSLSKLPAKDKAKDLVLYVTSPSYLALRKDLGTAIEA